MRDETVFSRSGACALLTATLMGIMVPPVALGAPGGVSAGIRLWLDASDPDADGNPDNNPANGTVVTRWEDKSGLDNDALRSNASAAGYDATYQVVDGINGAPTLRFNAQSITTGTVFNVPSLDFRAIALPKVTIFTVYRPQSSNWSMGLWGADNQNWDRFFLTTFKVRLGFLTPPNDGVDDGLVGLGPTNQGATVVDAGQGGVSRLMTVVYNGEVTGGVNAGPANGSAVYFNGKSVRTFTDSSDATDAQTSFFLGWDGDDNRYHGDIAEVIIYDRVLTAAELFAVTRYLCLKYSVDCGTKTEITGIQPSPVPVGNRYTVSGKVTLTQSSTGPAPLPGDVLVNAYPGAHSKPPTDVTVAESCIAQNPTAISGSSPPAYAFSCETGTAPAATGTRSVFAEFIDTQATPQYYDSVSAAADLTIVAPPASCGGFFAPVDRPPTLNRANAGRVIPLKWYCTRNGQPVNTLPADFAVTTSACTAPSGKKVVTDAIEEYATDAGVINRGSGWWQFNWPTQKSWARSCVRATVTFDGTAISADFSFVR